MTNEQLQALENRWSFLYEKVSQPYPAGCCSPYKRSAGADALKRHQFEHIFDSEGKVWSYHWKSEVQKMAPTKRQLETLKMRDYKVNLEDFSQLIRKPGQESWKKSPNFKLSFGAVDSEDDDHGHECKRKTGKYCGKCIDCSEYCDGCGGTGGHCSCDSSSDEDEE